MSDSIERAHDRVTRKVIDMKGVAGTAIGTKRGKPCIKVYLERDDPALRKRLPRRAGGVPVDVEVTGRMERWKGRAGGAGGESRGRGGAVRYRPATLEKRDS